MSATADRSPAALTERAPSPASTAATRGEHFRALAHGRSAVYAAVLGMAALCVWGAARHSPGLMVLAPFGWLAVIAATCLVVASRRAEADFYTGFAASLGLRHRARGDLPALVPLLRAGDRRQAEHMLEGELGGQPLTLAHYEFELRRRDSGGLDREHTTERRDFTVCLLPVAAPQGLDAGVFLGARRDILDRLTQQDWLHGKPVRSVELESSRFAERYQLRVSRAVDEVALRQLFAPSLVAWLAEHPLAPAFEYEAGVLAVYVERTLENGGTLTYFLDAARELARRFARRIA